MSFEREMGDLSAWHDGSTDDRLLVDQDGVAMWLSRSEAIWLQNVLREWLCSSTTIPAPPPAGPEQCEPPDPTPEEDAEGEHCCLCHCGCDETVSDVYKCARCREKCDQKPASHPEHSKCCDELCLNVRGRDVSVRCELERGHAGCHAMGPMGWLDKVYNPEYGAPVEQLAAEPPSPDNEDEPSVGDEVRFEVGMWASGAEPGGPSRTATVTAVDHETGTIEVTADDVETWDEVVP